jgi:hypothetical protein
MGYRSDVVLAIKRDKVTPKLEEAIKDLGEPDDTNHDEEVLRYKWEYIKWNGWEEDSIDNQLDQLEEEDYGIVRLGESTDDVEMRGYYWELGLDLSRTVFFT